MKVKICGITTLDDGLAAIEAGADLLGFNFYPPSPRYIAPARCAQLIADMRESGAWVATVGVFVNATPDEIRRILSTCGLDLAQLSGDEPPECLAILGSRAFKAIRPADLAAARAEAARYAHRSPPACLVDASAGAGRFGGTGQVCDWDTARALAAERPILLAGGLRPDNVAAAVTAVHPWGVDVASGVESRPGRKDIAKMRAFIQAARANQRATE